MIGVYMIGYPLISNRNGIARRWPATRNLWLSGSTISDPSLCICPNRPTFCPLSCTDHSPRKSSPEPDLEDQVYGNALMSQMAQFPHYDASLSTSLLRIFLEPTWYDKGKKFRLDHCAERLFAHAAPSAAFMKIWTRILVGNPEVEAPWHAFECGTARMLRLCTRHSPEFCPMEIWDAYSVLLVSNSPIITPEIQGLIISQTRYNFVGFRIILHKLFPVAREVLPLRRSGPELGQNEFDAAMLFVTLAEERQMRWMDEEEAWLKQVLPSVEPVWKARLARIKSSVSSSKDVILSTDVFCAWCLKKSANPKSCSRHRCKGPSYCDTECQRSAWKAHHKHVCTDDVDRFRTADSAIMNVRT
ncbi:hypothetical protein C8R43DRAFT_560060 [Mycena crocata]|nr:hypothetical protein C8R43DRAFT_560060 [Mycena crocata]